VEKEFSPEFPILRIQKKSLPAKSLGLDENEGKAYQKKQTNKSKFARKKGENEISPVRYLNLQH
jgi:hypothetical protein